MYRRRYKYLYGTFPASLFARCTGRFRSRRLQGERVARRPIFPSPARERIGACRFLEIRGITISKRAEREAASRTSSASVSAAKTPRGFAKALSDSRRHAAHPSDTRSSAAGVLIFQGSCSRSFAGLLRLLTPRRLPDEFYRVLGRP